MADLAEKARRAAEEWLGLLCGGAIERSPEWGAKALNSLTAAFKAFAEEARAAAIEECAQVCEDHEWHMDLGVDVQNHSDGPKLCCVAEAVRALARPTQGEKREATS